LHKNRRRTVYNSISFNIKQKLRTENIQTALIRKYYKILSRSMRAGKSLLSKNRLTHSIACSGVTTNSPSIKSVFIPLPFKNLTLSLCLPIDNHKQNPPYSSSSRNLYNIIQAVFLAKKGQSCKFSVNFDFKRSNFPCSHK